MQGVVWDADENAPYPGVTVQVFSNLRYFETVSAADGSYKISYVPPGTLTVGTPTGPKPGYYNVPVTANLAAGGIMLYNPRMSKTAPLTVAISAKTEKTIYRQGDTVALAVTMSNTRPAEYAAALHVQVTGPSGTSVYDTTETVNITANGTSSRNLSFVPPPSAVNGFYTVNGDLVDGNGIKKGSTSITFNLFLSQVAVTPVLPDRLAAGVNTISFNLSNPGTIDVATVRLEGGVVAESWPFAIGDHDRDGNAELLVKFRRSEVIEVLPEGAAVPVHVSGKVVGVSFEGVDVIRVTR